ncbi:biotin-dependent carboxyltransferase family protein [Brevibacterium casei]|uniref:5-oxoprolinase subunit C family protein n=1 Tax=Brevibacterium casei TaxID=33889 RepID=UPI00223BB8EB|nr:biotin-dependent carboxyltransferase family protein [Brevibacterium casei]MCT2182786.1 biotin-dependent carboxyltransferase family protein [Brevibacterium casei]
MSEQNRSTIEVLSPGLSTTVQDQGRFGYYNVGLPQGGSLDNYSSQAANMLVGNTADEAVLECTYMGANLRFNEGATIAVTGGDLDVTINGEPVPTWQTLEVPAGGTVEFGMLRSGARFYIAVHGGIDVPLVLGSRSTYPLGQMGGFRGRKLEAGDVLPIGEGTGRAPTKTVVAEEDRPSFDKQQNVRILMGLYDFRLTEKGKANLVEEEWQLTPVADRAGLRYSGPGVEWVDREQPFGAGSDPSNIVDAGYAVGSIQIPGGTQPIVLHRDAVSGGGYAMVATVISADMDLVARATPGTTTRFIEVNMDEALEARREYKEALARLWH